jgi:hypothetical protein
MIKISSCFTRQEDLFKISSEDFYNGTLVKTVNSPKADITVVGGVHLPFYFSFT